MSEKNIYQRINAVMKEVEYVQKDSNVSAGAGGSYKAVSHDMVIAVLRSAMVKHGIVVRTEQLQSALLQQRVPKGEKGHNMHLYSGDYAVHFVNIDNPEDYMTVTINAHANDNGDKAPGKAASYAVKYALLKTFSLETGESDESRTAEFQPFTDIQKEEFHSYITNNSDPLGFLCFTKTIGDEAFRALQGTFEAGQISSGKKVANSLITGGWDILKAAEQQISTYIDSGDTDAILEVVSEFETPVERKLLGGLLSADQIRVIKDVKSLSTEAAA